jgi:hypothetical protein
MNWNIEEWVINDKYFEIKGVFFNLITCSMFFLGGGGVELVSDC